MSCSGVADPVRGARCERLVFLCAIEICVSIIFGSDVINLVHALTFKAVVVVQRYQRCTKRVSFQEEQVYYLNLRMCSEKM